MSIPLVVNGITYNYPQTHDVGWGPVTTAWAQAITSIVAPLTGGFLTLPYPTSGIVFRNSTNTGNLPLTVNSSNQLTFNGTPIGATASLTDTHIFIGDALNHPADVALSGDATITDTGVLTISAGAIGPTKLANGTANQLIGANAAASANEFKTLNGTSNQVIVANGTGTITLSTPQDINTTSSPTFMSLTVLSPTSSSQNLLSVESTPSSGNYTALFVGSSTGTGPLLGNIYNPTLGSNVGFLLMAGDSQGSGISIKKGGNVGINTNSPAFNLDVNGTMSLGGNRLQNIGVPTTAGDAARYPITGSEMTNGTVTGTQIVANVALAGSPTTTIQPLGDASNKIATTNFVNPASSLATSGYQVFPNGMYMQWGISNIIGASGGTQSPIFPIAFPHAVLNVQATMRYTNLTGGTSATAVEVGGATVTQFTLLNSSPTAAYDVYWFAIGF